jgi:hypothetical protein
LVRDLFDTSGDRHAEVCHPIEDRASDSRLCILIRQSPGVKAPSNDDLVAEHRCFNQAPSAIAGTSLPAHPPVPFDRSEMRIASCRSVFAHDCRRSWRNDHISLGVTMGNFIVNHIGIIGSIACHRRNRTVDLIKQIRHRRDIADFVRSQFHRDDLVAVGINREMEFPPAPAGSFAVLLFEPFTLALVQE